MEPVSIGLVGYGNRGQIVADSIQASSDLDLVCVCDQIEERRKAARERTDVTAVSDYEELLDYPELEAVAVMVGVSAHAPLSIRALERGKHVLCTKPLAESVSEAARMVDAASREGLVAGVEFQRRFLPGIWTLRQAAVERDPLQVSLNNQRRIFFDRFLRPGYAWGLMDGTIHWVDIANWIVDYAPVGVSAIVRRGQFTDTEAIDTLTLQIEYREGRSASVVASMGGSTLNPVRQVVGAKGNVELHDETVVAQDVSFDDSYEEKERQRRSKETITPNAPGDGDANQTLFEQFAARIRGEGGDGLPTFEDGFETLRISKAAVRSHEQGERVHVADVAPDIGE